MIVVELVAVCVAVCVILNFHVSEPGFQDDFSAILDHAKLDD